MRRIIRIAGGSVLFIVLLASCAGDIVRPAEPASGSAAVPDDGVIAGQMRFDASSAGAVTPGPGVSGWVSTATGGFISNGRFSIWFPAGSVTKNTYVTVKTLKSGGSMVCEILPSNMLLAVPATLIVDLRGTVAAAPLPNTILWFDSQRQAWIDVGATPGSRGWQLETRIGRLGRYMAGWKGRLTP